MGSMDFEKGLYAMDDQLVIAGKTFSSRLMLGTGRYRNNEEMIKSLGPLSLFK